MKIRRLKSSGFTMIEILAVLVIIGVLTAVAAGLAMDTAEVDLIAQTEKIKAHLRYAQARAMNSDQIYGIRFSGGSYSFFENGNESSKVLLPGADELDVSLPQSVSPATIAFDSWGRPHTDAAGAMLQVGDRTVSVGSQPIVITENTGFIP